MIIQFILPHDKWLPGDKVDVTSSRASLLIEGLQVAVECDDQRPIDANRQAKEEVQAPEPERIEIHNHYYEVQEAPKEPGFFTKVKNKLWQR